MYWRCWTETGRRAWTRVSPYGSASDAGLLSPFHFVPADKPDGDPGKGALMKARCIGLHLAGKVRNAN